MDSKQEAIQATNKIFKMEEHTEYITRIRCNICGQEESESNIMIEHLEETHDIKIDEV